MEKNQEFRLESSYDSDGSWSKGNLHTHTTFSDGKLPPQEVISAYGERGYGFLAISDHEFLTDLSPFRNSTEMILISAAEGGGGPHVLCLGISEAVMPNNIGRQEMIDRVKSQGGFVILNHPNWGVNFSHWDQGELETLRDYAGIEIYNGVIERLEGSSLATDRWDRLLSKGIRIWGYANDDFHLPEDIGRGWVVAKTKEKSLGSVIEALRVGRFYASTGVEIVNVHAADGTIFVETSNAQRIRFIGKRGKELKLTDGGKGEYMVQGDEVYVRVECYGEGGRTAWTQPFWIN